MAADPQRDDDPPRPLGHVPVVLLTDPLLLDVVRAGMRRAGGDPPLRSAPGVDLRTLREAPPAADETVIALCDATALVDAVNRPDERRRRGRNAREVAVERYSWPALAEEVAAVYEAARAAG